ncbi:MAG: hypothetical protein LBU56_02030 [Rickettsiales bacterium]|nr:hypothetical protein [Rickettsiales bacterium]
MSLSDKLLPLPVGQEYEFAKEFEVWARIIKDSEGRDIHVFIKNDELRKFRRDSSFYWDGYWEVFEFDSLARSVRSRTSLGMKIERLHDQQWRLTNSTMIKSNDTLTSEQYIWESGRLVKMFENGLERIYIYGKTFQDPVRVIPSDEGISFHPGYDNSVGMMLDEKHPMYKFFAFDPYGSVFAGYKMEKPEAYSQSFGSQMLGKIIYPTPRCVESENPDKYFPKAECVRMERGDIPTDHKKHLFYPGENSGATYGLASFDFDITAFDCKCNLDDGLFHVSYNDSLLIVNKKIKVFFSAWYYKSLTSENWEERCWKKDDKQRTYEHEVKHLDNARKVAIDEFNAHMFSKYKTEAECIERSQAKIFMAYLNWSNWARAEKKHENFHPRSPEPDRYRGNYDICN